MTGHSDTALQASRIRLSGSTVTGNGLDLHADYTPHPHDLDLSDQQRLGRLHQRLTASRYAASWKMIPRLVRSPERIGLTPWRMLAR